MNHCSVCLQKSANHRLQYGLVAFFLIGWVLTSSWSAASQIQQASEASTAPRYTLTINKIVASGFQAPVQLTHAGDGSGRLFVVEQPGRIRVIKQGTALPTPFLDISPLVAYSGERGLLGLAFHPNYPQNGYLYVNYTRVGDGATVIARYTVSATDPDRADPTSAATILTIPQPYSNHNGGQLLFSPVDGYLYIGTGDGGSGGDPQNYAQNIDSLLGKMLRLDVDGSFPYAIPPDNPYVGRSGRDEIWAIGLRNPWRFSFDRATGDIFIGDVGQNLREEIDYQATGTPGGLNFGWRCMEGTHPYNFTGDCLTATLTPPIAEYGHDVGRSVTGGFIYRGAYYPALRGRYFYADYVTGLLWSIAQGESGVWSAPVLELNTGFNVSAFGEDEDGELYVIDYAGTIRHLADTTGPVPDLSMSRKRASIPSADPGETVTYTITLINAGGPVAGTVWLTDTLPAGLGYVSGSLAATQGTVAANPPLLTWQGTLDGNTTITVSYQVTVSTPFSGSRVNRALLSGETLTPLNLATSLAVPRTILNTTVDDMFFPGTQPGEIHAGIAPSVDCDTCHNAPIYDEWRGSPMGQAGRDALMWAALAVANVDAPGSGEYCLRCHTSAGWLEGRSHPPDGSALLPLDINNGVGCALCHRLVDPIPSLDDEAASLDQGIRAALAYPVPWDYVGSSTLIVDPNDNRRGPFSFGGALPYHTAYRTDYLGQASDRITRSRLCGSCHNVDNPILAWDEDRQQYWPKAVTTTHPLSNGSLFPIERTFDEWLYSDYARIGVYAPQFAGAKSNSIVGACQDCHMPRATGYATDQAFNPIYRDCATTGCLPVHTLVGGNTWLPVLLQNQAWRLNAYNEADYLDAAANSARAMLRKAATLQASLIHDATGKVARVRVINETGHKLPTGYPEGRQMWLHLRAFDRSGNVIYESGAYDAAEERLIRDADIKVYEAKQGLTSEWAAVLNLPPGESFHFVLNNTVIKDNRIPPRGYTQAAYDKPGLRPVGTMYADGQHWDDTFYAVPPETASIKVTLYYQVASREYIEFLERYGGVDGQTLGELWEASPGSPEIVASTGYPLLSIYLPLVMRR